MSKQSSTSLPAELVSGLHGTSAVADQVTLLTTVDENCYPRFSLLSRSEIYVVNDGELLMALWAGSQTSLNIGRQKIATLFRVDAGIPRGVRISCDDPTPLDGPGPSLVVVRARIVEVQSDDVEYAKITSTLGFEIQGPGDVLPRWEALQHALAALA